MSVNVHNIESVITAKLNDALTDDEILIYAKAIERLRTGSVFTVGIVAELPNINSVPDGALYFVDADRTLYWASRLLARWIGFAAARQIWSWGSNGGGQLGHNTATTCSRSSPVSVIGGITNWCRISAGSEHNLAIRSNGTLWAWGCNGSGRLGDNTAVNKSSPVSVIGGFTDWSQISASRHSLAIRANGTLWSWGCNGQGRLGDNTAVNKSSPVSVIGGFTDWCGIAANLYHSLAIRSNGTVWSWGYNGSGRLGDGTVTARSSPVSVIGGFTDWSGISAGCIHSLGLRSNGTLWSWGTNAVGQLGDGTTTARSSPVSVIGGFTDWCRIAAGGGHSAAIRANGTLWSWGCNGDGRLGDGTVTARSSPVAVVGGFVDWAQISAGYNHNLAVRTNGTVWSWGSNDQGQLGDGTTVNRTSPVSVVGGFTDWSGISADNQHSLAIRISG